MLTSVFTNGIRSPHSIDGRSVCSPDGSTVCSPDGSTVCSPDGSTVSPCRPGIPSRTTEPPPPLLEHQRDHDHDKERRPEQAGGDHVARLELPERQGAGAGTGLPLQLLLGEVEPPGGEQDDEGHRHDPEHQRDDHRIGPGPFPLLDQLLQTLDHGSGPLLEAPRNALCEPHPSFLWRCGVSELYRRASDPPKQLAVCGPSGEWDRRDARLVKAFTSIEDTIPRSRAVRNPRARTGPRLRGPNLRAA